MGSNCISRGDYANYCKGKGIREIIEDELDTIIDRLMTPGSEAADGRDPGRGEALSWCLAVIEEPYAPNMDKIKGEAMLRYEAKLREATFVQCSANTGGDPASGCDEEATGDDGLCDRHRALVEESDDAIVVEA